MFSSDPRCVAVRPTTCPTLDRGSSHHRLRLATLLVVLTCAWLAVAAGAASAAPRDFGTPRFQANDTGDITFVGNSLSTCQDGSADVAGNTCAGGRAGQNVLTNNAVPNQLLRVDTGAGAPSNSSSATFTLPAGAQVLWAGLYWGAEPGSSAAANVPNPAQTIQLRVPGSAAYQTITASQFDSGAPAPHTNAYQGFADVTGIVRAAGSGSYTAGGIPVYAPSNPGDNPQDSYGGWSLVIAVKDPSQPSRNLSVFDGFVGVTQSPKVEPTINVSGFLTPPTGAVNTKLGVIAYEGDFGLTGDYAQLNGQNISDAANPPLNFFNGSQSTLGVNRTARSQPDVNSFGYDADIVDVTGRIPNGATSAAIQLGTTQDVYAPGVVTLATQLYAPIIDATKSVANVTPGRTGPNRPGDTLRYTVAYRNTGGDAAAGMTISDAIPANTSYVPGTLRITSPGAAAAPTDAAGDDTGEYDAASRSVRFRPGAGGSATAGGRIAVGETATVTFDVRVAGDLKTDTRIDNVAAASYRAETSGSSFTDVRTPVASIVAVPVPVDLGITKSVTPGRINVGGEAVYTLDVVNKGPNVATGVVVSDTLPAGLTVLQTVTTQGACSTAGRAVRCDLGSIAVGGRAQVLIRARADAAGTLQNVAVVGSDEPDPNPTDNTTPNVPLTVDPGPGPGPGPIADLTIDKELINRTVEVGRVLTYRITVTNRGSAVARGVRVTDVPSRTLEVLGVKPSVGTCPGRSPITCDLGDLAPGQTAQITVSVRATTPGRLTNAATAVATGSPGVPVEKDVADTSVRRVATSVTVKKTASRKTLRGGQTVRFTIRVKNFTKQTVRKVLVCDTLPRGLVFQKAAPLKITGRKACGTIATLRPGQVRSFVLTVRAEARKTAKTLTNSARAVVPNELSAKARRSVRVLPGPNATGDGGVTG